MVVLWGLMEDGPLAAVARCLRELGTPTMFIDQRRILDYTFELEIDLSVCGRITGPDGSFDISRARSIYLRQYNFEQMDVFAGIERGSEQWRQAAQFEDAMMLWCEVADAKVVNRPSAMSSNSSKPYQLEIVREAGFAVPDTLITTDPDSVVAFWQKHKRVIYKSISSCRSIVSQFGEKDLATVEDVVCCPTQFQRFIEGTDYRVHVLEDKSFAHRITCPDDDYRYSQATTIESISLPQEIEEKCLCLTKKLGLLFSGIDLRRSNEGEWYCFEVNPSPGYTYFENGTNHVSLELAKYLGNT
jgi:ATP-grasp domain-containing protein